MGWNSTLLVEAFGRETGHLSRLSRGNRPSRLWAIEMSDDPRIAVIGPAIARHRLRSMSQVHLAAVIRLARNAVTIAVKLWAIPRLAFINGRRAGRPRVSTATVVDGAF